MGKNNGFWQSLKNRLYYLTLRSALPLFLRSAGAQASKLGVQRLQPTKRIFVYGNRKVYHLVIQSDGISGFSGLEQTEVFACQGHKPDVGRCSCLGYLGLGTRSRKPYNLNNYKSLKRLMLLTGVFFVFFLKYSAS